MPILLFFFCLSDVLLQKDSNTCGSCTEAAKYIYGAIRQAPQTHGKAPGHHHVCHYNASPKDKNWLVVKLASQLIARKWVTVTETTKLSDDPVFTRYFIF